MNNVFGEGASPKLRAVRHALSTVLHVDHKHSSVEITRHAMTRIVYGAFTASNARNVLHDEASKPDYYFDPDGDPAEQTQRIVEYWRERWLLTRLNFEDALHRIEDFDPATYYLGNELDQLERQHFEPILDEVTIMSEPGKQSKQDVWRDFVMGLYRGTSAYADQMDAGLLDELHVQTTLDKAVIEAVTHGKSVVLTGNPGDGKTHLLRMLEKRLSRLSQKPKVVYDASALTDEELLQLWQSALEQKQPFCVAINEAVLINLAQLPDMPAISDAQGQARSAQEQVEQAVIYDIQPTKKQDDSGVIAFDLSRRNVLSSEIVSAVLDKLSDASKMATCGSGTGDNDLIVNQRLLKTQRFRARLQGILDRVSQRGYHATPRELQAFVSFLLFAGRDCNQIQRHSGEIENSLPQLPFIGQGRIFHEAARTFDPARVSHPIWDEILVSAGTRPEDWLEDYRTWHSVTEALDASDESRFEARKRAFYFCHSNGDDLLKIAGDDESSFIEFLQQASSDNINDRRKALRGALQRINFFFGDNVTRELHVWQSHRFDQSSRRILYSAVKRKEAEFEIVLPTLCESMRKGFELALDHVLLRLKDNSIAKLRIDFPMFQLLAEAERGVPAIALDNDLTRRLWQFMERLVSKNQPEVDIRLFDLTTGDKLTVTVDIEKQQYLSIKQDK